MPRKKYLPPELLMAGVFLPYDGKTFTDYLSRFRRPGESINRFVMRIKTKYDPNCYVKWREGRQPDVEILKEIWWKLRHEGCQFSVLMRLAHGIECKEPEVGEYWKSRTRTQ